MADLPAVDARALLDYKNVARKIYMYDPAAKTVGPPTDIPWPIVFMLGRLHPKHILVSGKMPEKLRYTADINSFINKIKWRWALQGDDSRRVVMAKKKRHTSACPFLVPAPMDAVLRDLRRYLGEAVSASVRSARVRRGYSNITNLLKLGISCYRRSEYVALKNDKDGGFSLAKKQQVQDAQMEILRTDVYQECTGRDYCYQRCVTLLKEMAAGIARHERDHGMYSEVMKPAYNSGTTVAVLQCTVKTHKESGRVAMRPIHAMPSYLYQTAGKWLGLQLRQRLGKVARHLLRDSADLVERTRSIIVPATAKLCKVDLKDYFLSGSSGDLTKDVVRLWEGDETATGRYLDLVRDVLSYLLNMQYAKAAHSELIFQVIKGSGMGLPHSGEACDSALYVLAEKNWGVDPATMQRLGILHFFRFRDDVFIVYEGDQDKLTTYLNGYGRRAQYFRTEVETTNAVTVRYLELEVSIRANRLHCRQMAKPTSLESPPLAASSGHHRSVHKSWPVGSVKRIGRLCHDKEDIAASVATMRARFINNHTPTLWDGREALPAPRVPKQVVDTVLWMPIGFHPAMTGLTSAVTKYCEANQERLLHAWSISFRSQPGRIAIRPAWYNAAPSLSSKLRSWAEPHDARTKKCGTFYMQPRNFKAFNSRGWKDGDMGGSARAFHWWAGVKS